MDKILRQFKWQLADYLIPLRIPILYFTATGILLAALPAKACRYLDEHIPLAVSVVNIVYALSMLFFFFYGASYVNGKINTGRNGIPRPEGVSARTRLAARLAANTAGSLLCFGNLFLGSALMGKFGDESHSYFRLELGGNIPLAFLLFALAVPLLFRFFCLLARARHDSAGEFIALLLALALVSIWRQVPSRLPALADTLLAAGILILVFLRCAGMDKDAP